ncbi:AIPR family protein [Akkermansiaceae bacterium]|nr:AIPR family protein [Akkermansiaceae bacterium]MDB4356090.1 AIPR family protein [Akkermansiaceae bacterium]
MTDIEDYLRLREGILDDAKDEVGFVQDSDILQLVVPSLLESKLVDSSDANESYYLDDEKNHKINGYDISESGERLQLYIVNESSWGETDDPDTLSISKRVEYEKQFQRVKKFLRSTLAGNNHGIQDSDSIRPLISKLSSSEGFKQFDVIDIFLVSLTATVTRSGDNLTPRRMFFEDDTIAAAIEDHSGEKLTKDFLVMHHLIDLNFLHNVQVSKGNAEPLEVDFKRDHGGGVPVLMAASEENFESYLCVIPAGLIADLYKRYSTRLLEKNIRSFLQFRGVNAGIRKTLREEPEKFIAYNNGLTITSSAVKTSNRRGTLRIDSLTDFQIVNGGQTTASIFFSQKDGIDVSKVSIMAKINVAKMAAPKELDELISKISEFSNAQARVSKVDLRSRNPKLLKLKKLSDSVTTPAGDKWFFARAKGEFETTLRLNKRRKSHINKQYPSRRRFTKELLAKYYSAWGARPHLVKKGGEKIFRLFIEDISGETVGIPEADIDRDFYETVIAKIILFKDMERIYGAGKNSMGQIRAVVIPYSLGVLYSYSDMDSTRCDFNLARLWKTQVLEDDLHEFLKNLMLRMNDLIKRYSESDDLNEYSKKEELWTKIKSCKEIQEFMSLPDSVKILDKYAPKN